jgi:prefoldin beta subunit
MSDNPKLLIDEKLKVYKAIQQDIQKLYSQKQQSLSQLNENVLVKGELDLLKEDSKVYKLVGPVLLNVEIEEAKDNVGELLELTIN